MRVCPECKGMGCDICNYEGMDTKLTMVKRPPSKRKLTYQEYKNKRDRDLNKIDKKNAREEF